MKWGDNPNVYNGHLINKIIEKRGEVIHAGSVDDTFRVLKRLPFDEMTAIVLTAQSDKWRELHKELEKEVGPIQDGTWDRDGNDLQDEFYQLDVSATEAGLDTLAEHGWTRDEFFKMSLGEHVL